LISDKIVLEEDFDSVSNLRGDLVPKRLKRLMREIQKIAIVPNVPKTDEKLIQESSP
jgi:hypothetical protein